MPSFITRVKKATPDSFTIFIAGLAIMGAGIVLLHGLYNGPVITNDSIIYISTARNLIAGEGLIRWNGLPFDSNYPPAFPIMLAISSLLIFDPIDIALPLNAVSFGLTIFVAGCWLRSRLRTPFLAVWGCISIAFALPIVSITWLALSEPVFILLATLCLVLADKYLYNPSRSLLIWLGVLTAVACTTRYPGVSIILAVSLLLLLHPNLKLLDKARWVTIYLMVSAIPLCAWLLRNYIVSGNIAGSRPVPNTGLSENIYAALRIIAEWVTIAPLDGIYRTIAVGVAAAIVALLTATVSYMVIKRWRANSKPNNGYFILSSLAFSCAYLIFTVVAWSIIGNSPVNERYMAPAYIPMLFVFLLAMDRFFVWSRNRNTQETGVDTSESEKHTTYLDRMNPKTNLLNSFLHINHRDMNACGMVASRYIPSVLVALLSVWTCYAAYSLVSNTRSAINDDSAGWTSRKWSESPTIKYMQTHLTNGWIFSTAPLLTYIHSDADIKHRWLPRENIEMLPQWIEQQENSDEGGHLVMFYGVFHPATATDLRVLPRLEPVAEFEDGIVFRINKSYVPDIDSYRSEYATVTSRRPTVDTPFALYLNGNHLTYIKEQCTDADTDQPFILHIIPDELRDLSEEGRRNGFDTLDFTFDRYGVRFDGKCMATVELPSYQINAIRTGPAGADGEITWQVTFPFDGDGYHDQYESITSQKPEVQSTFNLYLNQNTLTYTKKPCAFTDTQLSFFLHVIPSDINNLPAQRMRYGFDNLDFNFDQRGLVFESICMATVELPSYQINTIRTGQWVPDQQRNLWQEEFSPVE